MNNPVMNSFMETIKMGYIFNLRSDSNSYQMMFSTVFFLFITYFMSNEAMQEKFMHILSKLYCKKYNCILLEGKRSFRTTNYNTRSDQLFSNRFNATWHYLAKNNENNKSIYSVKEFADSSNIYDENGDSINSARHRHRNRSIIRKQQDIFIVNQLTDFLLSDDIRCKVSFINEKIDRKSGTTGNIETIKLKIFSYDKSWSELKVFIDNITNRYISEIQNVRIDKRFIYSLIGKSQDNNDEYEHDKFAAWEECEFKSSRNFDNLFFEDKEKLVEKINFFNNNKDWYDKEGHPHTLGIGLSGPPGTGKTSVIKCIANMLNRHLIVIPLNKIKTQREFSQYYFETCYNKDNEPNSVTFDNKIIVFEDIDCMTDIVKQRTKGKQNQNNQNNQNITDDTSQILKKIVKQLNKQDKTFKLNMDNESDEDSADDFVKDFNYFNTKDTKSDKLTLSYLLNIIDGIRETPGRILIITSNNYDSLDEALIRPGRIDYSLRMNNASSITLHKMFTHYYGGSLQELDENYEQNKYLLKDFILSPAKIVNIRLQSNTVEEFIENLYIILKEKQETIKLAQNEVNNN